MLYLLYFQISTIVFVFFIDNVLISRGYFLELRDKITLFVIIALSIENIFICYWNSRYLLLLSHIEINTYILDIYRVIYCIPFLIIISLIDVFEKNVYDEDIINAIIIEIGIILLMRIESRVYLTTILCGAGTLFVATFFLSYFTKSLGMGDVLLYFLVGSFGGIIDSVLIFFVSFIVAAIYAIPTIIIKRDGDGTVAFTPFISIGFIITTLFF